MYVVVRNLCVRIKSYVRNTPTSLSTPGALYHSLPLMALSHNATTAFPKLLESVSRSDGVKPLCNICVIECVF